MKKIIVIGDKNNEFSKGLCQILREMAGIVFITSESINDYSLNDTDFLVCSLRSLKEIKTDNSFFIFRTMTNRNLNKNFLSKANYALFFDEVNDLKYENKITIGHTEDCDVIISSCNEDIICIGINKTINTLKGNQILPCEIKITVNKFSKIDKMTIVSSVIILLLSDENDNKQLEYNM